MTFNKKKLDDREEGCWPEYGFYSWHTGSNQRGRGSFIGETNSIAVSPSRYYSRRGATGSIINHQPISGLTCDTELLLLVVVVLVEMEVVPVFASAAATGYEYSSGFVMAINELRISGVLGVVQTPLSRPSIGGTVRLRLELNMVAAASFSSLLHEIFFYSIIIKMGINFFLFSLPRFFLLNSHSLSLFLHSLSHSTCVYFKVVYGVTFTLIKSNILKLTKNNHRSKSSTRLALSFFEFTIAESF